MPLSLFSAGNNSYIDSQVGNSSHLILFHFVAVPHLCNLGVWGFILHVTFGEPEATWWMSQSEPRRRAQVLAGSEPWLCEEDKETESCLFQDTAAVP